MSDPWAMAWHTSGIASADPELLHDGLDRERHVRAGVAVGDRVDVEAVERLLVDPERIPEAGDDPADVGRAELVESRHAGAS